MCVLHSQAIYKNVKTAYMYTHRRTSKLKSSIQWFLCELHKRTYIYGTCTLINSSHNSFSNWYSLCWAAIKSRSILGKFTFHLRQAIFMKWRAWLASHIHPWCGARNGVKYYSKVQWGFRFPFNFWMTNDNNISQTYVYYAEKDTWM